MKKFIPTDRQIDVISQMWAQNVRVQDIAASFSTTPYCINALCRRYRDKFPQRDGAQSIQEDWKVCSLCGVSFRSKWKRSKYCEDCSYKAQQTASCDAVVRRAETRNEAIDWIKANRGKQKTRLTDIFDEPSMEWSVTFSIPYSNNASKNRRWRLNPGGAVYMLQEVRKFDAQVQRAVTTALAGRRVAQNKVWVSFYVEKPDHKSDAINVVDTLCDAIKKAVDIDDRWFSIGKLDWCIKKENPSIIVSIAQESCDDVLSCSHCGEIKTLDYFSKNKGGPFGRARVCIECRRVLDKFARKRAA